VSTEATKRCGPFHQTPAYLNDHPHTWPSAGSWDNDPVMNDRTDEDMAGLSKGHSGPTCELLEKLTDQPGSRPSRSDSTLTEDTVWVRCVGPRGPPWLWVGARRRAWPASLPPLPPRSACI
jgi:hypothetical protein